MPDTVDSKFLVGQFVIMASPQANLKYEVTGFHDDGSDVLYNLFNGADGEVLKDVPQSRLTGTNKHNAAAWIGHGGVIRALLGI